MTEETGEREEKATLRPQEGGKHHHVGGHPELRATKPEARVETDRSSSNCSPLVLVGGQGDQQNEAEKSLTLG